MEVAVREAGAMATAVEAMAVVWAAAVMAMAVVAMATAEVERGVAWAAVGMPE